MNPIQRSKNYKPYKNHFKNYKRNIKRRIFDNAMFNKPRRYREKSSEQKALEKLNRAGRRRPLSKIKQLSWSPGKVDFSPHQAHEESYIPNVYGVGSSSKSRKRKIKKRKIKISKRRNRPNFDEEELSSVYRPRHMRRNSNQ